MEARNCTTGYRDEHHREDGIDLPLTIDQRTGAPQFGQLGTHDQEVAQDADSHEDETCGKERIDTTDDLIDGAKRSYHIIDEYDANPPIGGDAKARGHVAQQFGRTTDKNGTHKDHQHGNEDTHQATGMTSQEETDDFGQRSTIHSQRNHSCEVIVSGSSEDGTQYYPKIGSSAKLCTHNGTEYRTKACDIQKLNHVHLPSRQRDVVNAILAGVARCRTSIIDTEHTADETPIDEIADNESGQSEKKTNHF